MTLSAAELAKILLQHPEEDEEDEEEQAEETEDEEREELFTTPYCHTTGFALDQGGYFGTGLRVIEGQPDW